MKQFLPTSRYLAALGFAAAVVVFTPAAQASTWDKRTTVSFSQAIEVPGAVLQPGKYVMKLVDLPAERHVVQFMNERENHTYALALAIPTYREQVTDRTVITFYEAPVGQPEAIKDWYYPGDNYGQEFLYPKSRGGTRLASFNSTPPSDASLSTRNETNVSPVTTPEPVSPPPAQAAVVTSAPAPEPVEIAQATPPKQEEPVTVAQNTPPPTATSDTSSGNTAQDNTLPKTASNLTEISLLGLFSLVGAFGVRKLRKSVN